MNDRASRPVDRTVHPSTRCVHGPRDIAERPIGKPLVPPVVRSTIFHLGDVSYETRRAGRIDLSRTYARESSPTIEDAEERIAALEGAERSLVFASGMAALHACAMATLDRGDNVVGVRQLYGGSFSLFRALLPKLDVELRVVDVDDERGWREAVDARTRLFLCESISNPLTAVADLPAIAEVLRAAATDEERRALLLVDATLASPVGQRPLAHGADLVYHSATKYLGGHSDLTGGVVSGNAERLQRVWQWRNAAGGCMDPDCAALLTRGLRTLGLRVRAQTENALALARFLEEHPRVRRVHYCGLPSDPSFATAQRVLEQTSGLLSFVVEGGDDEALRVVRRLRIAAEAASLGSVETLATRPVDLSHAYLTAEERERAGIAPGLIRLAVGIEDVRDLEADLAQALEG